MSRESSGCSLQELLNLKLKEYYESPSVYTGISRGKLIDLGFFEGVPGVEHSPYDIDAWLKETSGGHHYMRSYGSFWFDNEELYVMFKLLWGK